MCTVLLPPGDNQIAVNKYIISKYLTGKCHVEGAGKEGYTALKCVRLQNFTFMLPCIVIDFFLNNQPDALIVQIYSVIKLYMFRGSYLPIIRSFPLYIRHW